MEVEAEAEAEMKVEADADAKMEVDAEAERSGDHKGEDEAAERLPMRRLRERRKVYSSLEVAERQKRMKETDGDPSEKDREVVRKGEEVGSEAAKIAEERKQGYEKYLEWKRRKEEQEPDPDPEKVNDSYAFEARMFRKMWDSMYLKKYGSFDKKTDIPCKRFTFNPAPEGGSLPSTLQVFYVKVEERSDGLQWPLEVFGMVALRDPFDYSRNIIFERGRDNCQILTNQKPYLALTGPVRAVVVYDTVLFEAVLYVKGATRSDDKELSLIGTTLTISPVWKSDLIKRSIRSRLSTLELMLAHIIYSVEATIEVRITSGSWPDGFHCRLLASTDSIVQSVVLLETPDDEVPLLKGDEIILARQVVSVENHGNLTVAGSMKKQRVRYSDRKAFKPLEMGTSSKKLRLGHCMLEVTVYWSRFP